ncbi:MAG: isoprenylcysteine carboxylmethyltransferase family protein [Acidobacteriota bacterium]|nr:isoprenylcysteine carboxylmethyltransferase family protein [Acidobacteriota bacterium]
MSEARYVLAVIVLIGLPPGILLWLAIHPWARFWRRLGPVWTYTILGPPMLALMAGLFRVRGAILAIDLGTSVPLIALAVVTLAAAGAVAVKRRKHLTSGVLAGLPELSRERYPGRLLSEGIYGRIRHPRYVEVLLWALAYALFANYLAIYVLVALSVPVLYLVVVLEERELRDRFGQAYEDYCREVPRFFPRRR